MTDDAIDEWLTRAIPPGSGRYYAILHASDASRRRLQAITALVSVWAKLCFSNREIEVAQKKLDWWREELQRDTSLHPITRELQLSLETSPGNVQRADLVTHLQIVLEAYGSLLTSGSPASDAKNKEFHLQSGATSCLLLCNLPTNSPASQKISQAGVLFSRLRCLRYLQAHIANGLMCLPMSDLEANGIKPNQFIPGNTPENAKQYLSDSIDTLAAEIQETRQGFAEVTFTASELDGAKAVYVYLNLQLKLLNTMRKNIDALFLPEVRLSPLRNYWHAFRAAAQFEKNNLTT